MTSENLIGRTIAGKYRVESLVGQGAMGCVYRVKQTQLGTTLALKVLHRPLANDAMFAARFLREAQAASRVDHPNSMRVVDFGEEPDGNLYIAMEYVDGKTLAQIIEEESPLAVWRIVDIASQALAALAVAHDLGVVHRDLKPENIMVVWGEDDEGRTHDLVKVCDFGVAKLLEGGSRGPNVTAEGMVVGTPEYMSPEQARGESLDARSDIYAMGVLLFQLMTGKVPFDSSTAFGTALMHVNDEPTQPHLLNPRVDKRLERICLKAMRKRPADRHSSARELRGELRALLEHEDEEVVMNERETLKERKKKRVSDFESDVPAGLLAQIDGRPRRSGWAISAVVIAGVLGGGLYLHHRQSAAPVALREPVQSATITAAPLPKPAETPPAAVATAAPPPAAAEEDKPHAHPHVAHGSARHAAPKTQRGAGPSIAIGEDPSVDPKVTNKEPAAKVEAPPASTAAKADAPKPAATGPKPEAPKPASTAAKADAPKPAAPPAEAPLPDFPVPKAEPPAKPAAPPPPPPALPPLEP